MLREQNLVTALNEHATGFIGSPEQIGNVLAIDDKLDLRQLQIGMALSNRDILEAQRLRYRVFVEEMGADLPTAHLGIDRDSFDEYCEHLIVRDLAKDKIVGTYRILRPEAARHIGRYYSEQEFDISAFQPFQKELVEIGRSCIDPHYRHGAVIAMLWSGLAKFMQENHYRYLMGCASINMADGGHFAASLFHRLQSHLAPESLRVTPHLPLPLASLRHDIAGSPPPLVKGYLRAGAWICGDPAWDPEFNTADLPILLPIDRLDQRYFRHFVGK